jgi:hypothetical protein
MLAFLSWTVLAGSAILGIVPASAQTYDPSYPVCLQIWEWGGSTHFECAFASWNQCRSAAIGIGAMCVDNPYWAPAHPRRRSGRAR